MAGVQIGLKDLHYAKLTKDTSTTVTYGTPASIAGAISAKVSPAVNTATLYADDGPDEVTSALGEITVELVAKTFLSACRPCCWDTALAPIKSW